MLYTNFTNKIYGQKKMWQDFQKDIKKYDLILKSGNYKKGINAYKIRVF